eukprot:UN24673
MALSPFQEEIITTGSGIAISILWVLAILFIIRAIQLLYERVTKINALAGIKSVLSEAKTIAAHKVGDFFNHNESKHDNYNIVYCGTFGHKDEYEEIMESEPENKKKFRAFLFPEPKRF